MSTTISVMPSAEGVTELLERMVPGLQSLEVAADTPALDSLKGPIGSFLKDDADDVVGMILLDFIGAVEMGGELMMTPVGGREDLIDEGKLDEFAKDAVSELINVLTTTINVTKENPRVRSAKPLPLPELLTEEAGAWLGEDHDRVDYECKLQLGTGRLVYLSRRG